MTIGYCHVKAGDFRMTSGFLITMGGTLNLHKILDTTDCGSLPNAIIYTTPGETSMPSAAKIIFKIELFKKISYN